MATATKKKSKKQATYELDPAYVATGEAALDSIEESRISVVHLCQQCGFEIAKGEQTSACLVCKKEPLCESCECDCVKEKAEEEWIEELKPGETVHAPDGSGTVTTGHPPEYYTSPEYLEQFDAETEKKSQELLAVIGEYSIEEAKTKAKSRSLKKFKEAAEEDYLNYLDQRQNARGKVPDPKPAQLFPDPDKEKPVEVNPANEAWKETPISELVEHDGLSAKTAEILLENGLSTLGKIADYTQPNASGWCNNLTDLKGLGPKKHEELEEATTRFWARQAANGQATRSEDSVDGVEGNNGEPVDAGADEDGAEAEADSE